MEDYNIGVRYVYVCIDKFGYVDGYIPHIQPSVKRRKYGVDPVAHKQRMDHIKEVTEFYSSVRSIRGFKALTLHRKSD